MIRQLMLHKKTGGVKVEACRCRECKRGDEVDDRQPICRLEPLVDRQQAELIQRMRRMRGGAEI